MSSILLNTAIATGSALVLSTCVDKANKNNFIRIAVISVIGVAAISAFGAGVIAVAFGAMTGGFACMSSRVPVSPPAVLCGALFGAAVGAYFAFVMPAPTAVAFIGGQVVPIFPIS